MENEAPLVEIFIDFSPSLNMESTVVMNGFFLYILYCAKRWEGFQSDSFFLTHLKKGGGQEFMS